MLTYEEVARLVSEVKHDAAEEIINTVINNVPDCAGRSLMLEHLISVGQITKEIVHGIIFAVTDQRVIKKLFSRECMNKMFHEEVELKKDTIIYNNFFSSIACWMMGKDPHGCDNISMIEWKKANILFFFDTPRKYDDVSIISWSKFPLIKTTEAIKVCEKNIYELELMTFPKFMDFFMDSIKGDINFNVHSLLGRHPLTWVMFKKVLNYIVMMTRATEKIKHPSGIALWCLLSNNVYAFKCLIASGIPISDGIYEKMFHGKRNREIIKLVTNYYNNPQKTMLMASIETGID